ncbi:MAG: Fe-S cluster assembly protein SufD [Pseudomonadota bacterium]
MNVHPQLASTPTLGGLLQERPAITAGTVGWLNRLRLDAAARVDQLNLPTTRDEDWRFTDLAPLLKFSFRPVYDAPRLTLADVQRFSVPEAVQRLVFADGHYIPALSTPTAVSGVTVINLAEGLSRHGVTAHAHLARHADFQRNLFSALNTSALQDGALVIIGKDYADAAPIHLLFIAGAQDAPVVNYPRVLVVTEAHSRCTLIEDYVSLAEQVYFTDAVSEIAVGEHAHVRHVRLQRESRAAFHIAHGAVSVAHGGVYASTAVTLGARLSRLDLHVQQNGEGMDCTLDGLALIAGRQLADTHSTMDHAQPRGKSMQLHKCIVDGAAHAVFNGKIGVRAGAQLTDAQQSSRNLLLSEQARVDTKPQLEIFADDVKCAHGATVGQLDAEELFYLKSRGLDEATARNLLTYAFAAEIIDKIPVASLKQQLRRSVLNQTRTAAL